MNSTHFKSVVIASIPLALSISGAGVAETPAESEHPMLPEILIEAGPVNRSVVGRSSSTDAPIESVTVDYHVRYSDLDLVKHADVLALRERIETAARDACGELDKLFPLERSSSQTRTCTRNAINGASEQVQHAIVMAQNEQGGPQ